jgi:hypothetical protein
MTALHSKVMSVSNFLSAKLLSFDVIGTLINVRDGSYAAFHSILEECGRADVDVRAFWEHWEDRNIAHYWEPYRPYKEICELSLAEAFAHFGVNGRPQLIHRYFDAFAAFEPYPEVGPTLEVLSRRHRLAITSNIDDDLLRQRGSTGTSTLSAPPSAPKATSPTGRCFAISSTMPAWRRKRYSILASRNIPIWSEASRSGLGSPGSTGAASSSIRPCRVRTSSSPILRR